MISYAQNLEDVMLARLFRDQATGFYVDIGAWDPTADSVTKHFYDAGWRGINVEPVPGYHERLQAERERDVNLGLAVGEHSGRRRFQIFEGTGLSLMAEAPPSRLTALDASHREIEIEVISLRELCERYVSTEIDFLKIDVEGTEGAVIRGGDWSRYRPRVVLVEAVEANPEALLGDRPTPITELRETCSSWEPLLLEADYEPVYFDGLNRFYLRREDERLWPHFAAPPTVWDRYERWSDVHARQVMEEYIASLRETLESRDQEIRRLREAPPSAAE